METDASGYVMRAMLMQRGRLVYYHYEIFHGVVLNYPIYDNELYALVHVIRKWKDFLMGKDIAIHTIH